MSEVHLLLGNSNIGEDLAARTAEMAKWVLTNISVTHLYIEYEVAEDILEWANENDLLPVNIQIISDKNQELHSKLFDLGYEREGHDWTIGEFDS